MSIKIRLPALLREYVENKDCIDVSDVDTVRTALEKLSSVDKEMQRKIFNESGEIQGYLKVFLNNKDIVTGNGLDSSVTKGDEIFIIASIAGG